MILCNLNSAVHLVVDRHELWRGRWDRRRVFDIAFYIGPVGLHLLLPGLHESYVAAARRRHG